MLVDDRRGTAAMLHGAADLMGSGRARRRLGRRHAGAWRRGIRSRGAGPAVGAVDREVLYAAHVRDRRRDRRRALPALAGLCGGVRSERRPHHALASGEPRDRFQRGRAAVAVDRLVVSQHPLVAMDQVPNCQPAAAGRGARSRRDRRENRSRDRRRALSIRSDPALSGLPHIMDPARLSFDLPARNRIAHRST